MHVKTMQKYYSMMLIFVLLLSLFTPAAAPLTGKAASSTQALSVAEAISLNNDGSEQMIQGFIVGHVKDANSVSNDPATFNNDYNFAIADDPSETNTDNMLYVQLTTDYRANFGLQSNPENLSKEVVVTGTLEGYFSNHNGLKGPSEIVFVSNEPVPELDLKTIAEARDQGTGEVKTKGIVTAKLNNTIHIQDDAAAIAIRPPTLNIDLGDEITVTGNLDTYKGLLQLQNAIIEDEVSNVGVPEPILLNGSDLNNHQSKLAVVENVKLTDAIGIGNSINYVAEDALGHTFIVRDENNTLGMQENITYESITGIVSQFEEEYQIIPRNSSDIVADSSVVQSVIATPGEGVIPSGSKVTLTTSTPEATIYFTVDGTNPRDNGTLYKEPILVNQDVIIKAIAEKEGMQRSDESSFAYSVYEADEGIKIHHIQGESHLSPLKGQIVENVGGIVTYKYEIRGSNYFHMQTPENEYDGNPKTSEGIVVYTGNQDSVEVGDSVEVTGKVDEYHIDGYSDRNKTDLSITQINARNDHGGGITIKESNVELPEPIKITSSDIPSAIVGENGLDVFEPDQYAIDFWESIEGMRVEVAPSKAVAPQQHGDLVVMTEEFSPENQTINGGIRLTENGPNAQSIQFKLHPNQTARDFAVKTGDKFTNPVTGVVNYGFGNYKVYADLQDVQAAFKEGNTEPQRTNITKDENKLSIATYNVENFSANVSETPAAKAKNIARAFVEDMNSPDIIGVVEVMDNNGRSAGPNDADASESYKRLISEIGEQGGPTYDYTNINPEYNKDGGAPDGNIRVGFLYNSDRVQLMEGIEGTATQSVDYTNGKLTLNPGRISPTHPALSDTRKPLAAQFEFKGESVVVIANHFNSKRGDDGAFGKNQPPVLGSEPQRIELAKLVNQFVKDIKQDNPYENVVVLGDMNDFEFSKPLQALQGSELINLMEKLPAKERYTYIYQGNSQVLDHILVSNHLGISTEVDVLHVNADFTDMHGRVSDHDPILAQIDLHQFNLSIMHLNDTHARVENYPNMISAIKDVRKKRPDSLLLHGGDVFSGTLYFNEFKGQADLELMNMMDIDAMVFGNHEFDLGAKENGHKSLSEFVAGADFPFLGTNIDFSGDPFMKGYETNASLVQTPNNGEIYNSIVKVVNGEKIGIFGLTTEDTIHIANPMEVKFNDFKVAAQKAVQEFEEAGINKVIAVNHIGFDSTPDVGNDLRLAQEVEGIDVIVGGHSHSELKEPIVIDRDVNGNNKAPTIIVQAGDYGKYLGTVDVSFNENGEIITYAGELLKVANYEPDEEAIPVMEKYKQQIEEKMNEETGAVAMKELINPRQDKPGDDSVRANETELGNLITDAMLEKAREKYPETVIAFQNGGGIRAPIDKGPITTGEIISVLPFGNDPVVATLTGQEIKDILEHSVRLAPAENGGFLHVSGMKFYYDSTREPGDRIVAMYVLVDGKEKQMHLETEYLITTNGFTGQGGDGFETFATAYEEGRVKDIGEIDWQQLRDYMVEDQYLGGIVDPEREGRIIDLNGEPLPELPNGEEPMPEDPGTDPSPDDKGASPGHGVGSDDDLVVDDKIDEKETEEVKDGEKLPKTATSIFTYLLIGIVLLLVGACTMLYYKRKTT
ncbi:5'-nucleotidase C-terminal domain-containing protein [Virgibacillus sp. W0430]|uniref:5'-nucleotidase C-terminal domain-containing protein n=1 Tax=Virgibacillus sp. W0430 TaxID=3391580 RepID=UPI003F47EB51